VAGLRFSPRTTGVSDLEKPSLLWYVVADTCGKTYNGRPALGELVRYIEKVMTGRLGNGVRTIDDAEAALLDRWLAKKPKDVQDRINGAIARFVSEHTKCAKSRAYTTRSVKPEKQKLNLETQIKRFLALIDTLHLYGIELNDVLRVAGLDNVFGNYTTFKRGKKAGDVNKKLARRRLLSKSSWRSPRVNKKKGLTGFQEVSDRERRTLRTHIKYTLLWYLLHHYCDRIPQMINWLSDVFRTEIARAIEKS